jgi:hypothetical protein
MGDGLIFDALVQGMQIGGLAGGDGENDVRVTWVADDVAPRGLDTVIGPDFPGQRAGERGGRQDGGAFVAGDRDADVAGPVGGNQQSHDPAQREQADHQADAGGGGPDPASVVADVGADAVVEQGAVGELLAEHAQRRDQAPGPDDQEQQAEHDEGDAVGAVGVHQRLRGVTRTLMRGG